MRILRQVMIDRAPPVVLAQVCAQHVQNCAATRVRISVKDRIGVGVVFGHYGPALPAPPGLIVGLLIRFDIQVKKVILAQMVLVPHRLKVRRETFIEPNVRPAAAS